MIVAMIDVYNKNILQDDCCGTLTAHGNTSSTNCGTFGVIQVGNTNPSGKGLNGTVVSDKGLARTVTTEKGEGQRICTKEAADSCRIRKLTPRECWRLMGISDEDFDNAASVNSNTQLYKEAGNSIVKPVLMAIFRQLNIKGVEKWNEN